MNAKSILGVIIGIAMVTVGATTLVQSTEAFSATDPDARKAPPAISGENVYVAWWTNNTANNNEEIMFRASIDGGSTFGDKINLSKRKQSQIG